jgi:hypothetical protein
LRERKRENTDWIFSLFRVALPTPPPTKLNFKFAFPLTPLPLFKNAFKLINTALTNLDPS